MSIIPHLSKSLALRSIIWIGIVCLIISLGLVILWLETTKNQPKLLTGLNLYKHPVTLSINGEDNLRLQPFDTYAIPYESKGKVALTIHDNQGKKLGESTHELNHRTSITLDVWSEKNFVKQCLVEAEISNLFYPENEENSSDIIIKTLSAEANHSFKYVTTYGLDLFVAPGNYSGKNLPLKLPSRTKVFGIYPVECNEIGNESKLKKRIQWWTDYSPSKQRELLAREEKRLADLQKQLR